MIFNVTNSAHYVLNAPGQVEQYFLNELGLNQSARLESNSIKLFEILMVDKINVKGPLTYISKLAQFDDDDFYLLDVNCKKAKIDNACNILFEDGFDPEYLYEIVEYFSMKILPKVTDSYYLHASAMKYKGKTIVFTGCNNTGKTKVLLEFAKKGAEIIGDDWTILDSKGYAYKYTRKIRMYSNDIISSPELVKNKFIIPYLLHDVFRHKNSGIMRYARMVYEKILIHSKVIPLKLAFDDFENKEVLPSVSIKPNKIDYIFLYSKYDGDSICSTSIDSDVVAERMIHAINNENRKVEDFESWKLFAHPLSEAYEGKKWKGTMRESFTSSEVHWLKIPFKADFKDVQSYIEERFCNE